MKTYRQLVDRLEISGVCLDGSCGITLRSHRAGFLFLGTAHWQERRVTKRGLRRFLLMIAKRDRLANPDFLNDPALFHFWFYLDERRANEWAARLGIRFPISYSLPERRTVSLVPGLSRLQPAVYAWAQRGVTP